MDTARKDIKAAEQNGAAERTEETKTPEPPEEGPAEEAGRTERSDSRGSPQGSRRYVQMMGSGLLAEMKAKQERRAACAQKVRREPCVWIPALTSLVLWKKRGRKIARWLNENVNTGCWRDSSVVKNIVALRKDPGSVPRTCTVISKHQPLHFQRNRHPLPNSEHQTCMRCTCLHVQTNHPCT